MLHRIKRAARMLAAEHVDGFLLPNIEESAQPDTRYLTGFSGTTSWLLVTATGKSFLFVDARYHGRARVEARGCKVIAVAPASQARRGSPAQSSAYGSGRHGSPFAEALLDVVRTTGIRKIGFDSATTSVYLHERLWSALYPVQLVSIPDIMRRVRLIKDEQEIVLLKKAARITTNAFEDLLKKIKIGMTEQQVAGMLDDLFYAHGATGIAFPAIVASGVNGSQPHAQPSTKKLKAGELVTIDCGASYKGYMADMTRTIGLGPIGQLPPKLSHVYEAVEAAQQAGKQAVKPAAVSGGIDAICRESLRKHGLDSYFGHGTGHGVGLAVHELPVLGPGSETILESGMVLTVEPGVYLPRLGGVRIEDTLLVTPNGSINLTKGIKTNFIWLKTKK
jgi:Xaa-Pro aminopeptidase